LSQAVIPVRRSESAHFHRRRPGHPIGFSHSSSDQSVGEVHRCCEYRDEATSVTVATTANPVTGHSVGHGSVYVQRDFNQSTGTTIVFLLTIMTRDKIINTHSGGGIGVTSILYLIYTKTNLEHFDKAKIYSHIIVFSVDRKRTVVIVQKCAKLISYSSAVKNN